MRPSVPSSLLQRAAEWDVLHRWERSELGKELRRLGLTYDEIRKLIPVPKGTLSYWCREIDLSEEQVAAIRERTGPETRVGIPVDTQWRRREEIDGIREDARALIPLLKHDPQWAAGTVMYWAEGSKTKRNLSMVNTDAEILRIFIAWTGVYHAPEAAFSLSLHLHSGNDEPAARTRWANVLELPDAQWNKTFVKPEGTGHRKNRLRYGVCRVEVHRSTDAFERTMAWIEGLRGQLT